MRAPASFPVLPRTYTARPAAGGGSVRPQERTLYSSAHARPSSVTAQCSSGDAAPIGEEPLVQSTQLVMATMDVRPARGLADVGVGLERRHGGGGVTRRERALVPAHDAGHLGVRILLQQRRTDGVAAGQRPTAEVDT